MLRIYGYAESINVRKVLWMCDELELPFERIDWGGRFASTADPQFRALNPVGMVPVIDDEGAIVWESNVIVRYLSIPCTRPRFANVERYHERLLERRGFRTHGRDGGP